MGTNSTLPSQASSQRAENKEIQSQWIRIRDNTTAHMAAIETHERLRERLSSAPNAGRVQRWVSVHDSMRRELESMRSKIAFIEGVCSDAATTTAVSPGAVAPRVDQIIGRLERFMSLLEDHAEFEETALFPALRATVPALADPLDELDDQHGELHERERVALHAAHVLLSGLESEHAIGAGSSNQTKARALLDAFVAYRDFALAHLRHEELSLIPAWIGMTVPAYKRFQETMAAAGHSVSAAPQAPPAAPKPVQSAGFAAALQTLLDTHGVRLEDLAANASLLSELMAANSAAKKPAPAAPAPKPAAPKPQLLDRYGNVVDVNSPGCCFDGVDSCCKGSAYARLLRRQ
eukprot:Amastigsp_a842980_61.p1 type:complete len:349 gc:universal Amastigsp_a842980_61:1-1047(+)